MQLFPDHILAKLKANGEHQASVKGTADEKDFHPVVKIFNPYGTGTWLLTEMDPEDNDILFGLCDLGCPELGSVRRSELEAPIGKLQLRLERDKNFVAKKPLSQYARDAVVNGFIEA